MDIRNILERVENLNTKVRMYGIPRSSLEWEFSIDVYLELQALSMELKMSSEAEYYADILIKRDYSLPKETIKLVFKEE